MAKEHNPVAVKLAGGTSRIASGTATAPGAGTDIVTLAAPPAGLYMVEVTLHFNVTAPAAVEDRNWVLRANNANISQLGAPRAINVPITHRAYVQADGTNPITLRANAAGTAAVVYVGTIVATRIGP